MLTRKQHQKKYRHWLRRLRKGQLVFACYDGKLGRAQPAKVLRQRKGVVIATFTEWGETRTTTVRFVNGCGWSRDPTPATDHESPFYSLVSRSLLVDNDLIPSLPSETATEGLS